MTTTFQQLINSEKPVLVDFYATWCGPCQAMAPVLEQIKEELGDKVRIVKVDVDKNTKAAVHYGVRGVPTFVLFRNGEVVWREAGALPKHELMEVINQYAS